MSGHKIVAISFRGVTKLVVPRRKRDPGELRLSVASSGSQSASDVPDPFSLSDVDERWLVPPDPDPLGLSESWDFLNVELREEP